MFYTAWNLAPEFVLSSFAGAELQQAFTLYTVGGIAVAVLVAVLAWPRLASPRSLPAVVPVPAPGVV